MRKTELQHRETLLLETLMSSLDARAGAKEAMSPMLLYLSELLVQRAREEVEAVRLAIEGLGEDVTNGDASA